MAKKTRHVSATPATAWLRRHGVAFSEHPYDYVEHGGTAESARQLGVDEHCVVKTLVMQDERGQPLLVLMLSTVIHYEAHARHELCTATSADATAHEGGAGATLLGTARANARALITARTRPRARSAPRSAHPGRCRPGSRAGHR